MAIRRGGFRCFKSAFERLCIVPHNQQKEVEQHLTTGLSSFDIGKAALIATASRTAARIAAHAGLKRSASLLSRIVYSVEWRAVYHNLRPVVTCARRRLSVSRHVGRTGGGGEFTLQERTRDQEAADRTPTDRQQKPRSKINSTSLRSLSLFSGNASVGSFFQAFLQFRPYGSPP
jgi:hypothetical protein